MKRRKVCVFGPTAQSLRSKVERAALLLYDIDMITLLGKLERKEQ